MSKKVCLLMLVLQMLTREKSRNPLRQGKEEIKGPHVKSAGLLGFFFVIEGLKDCFSCVLKKKSFVKDFYFSGKD